MRMEFRCEYEESGKIVKLTTEEESLPEILEDIKHFLLGCGFHIKGDIVVEGGNDDL